MTSREETSTSAATLRRAYLTMDRLQRQLDEYKRASSEPIAIVGMGCRFPGGAVDADSYWRILSNKIDAVADIPADRWDVDAFYDPEPQRPGKMTTRWGGFLDRVDQFDYEFFGISRREALAMDPQQRLTLEVAWEALEDAGQAPGRLAGSRTGVFLGVCSNDFATRTFRHPLDITAYVSTGTAHSVVPGRLSYLMDFRGPSVAIDSACSSALVAVHTAAQSLRAGECDMAVSGGVNVVVSPMPSIAFSQFPGMVSPDGRCKTFDEAANGYVRSEGCGIVVLKRLSDAVRDGDRVLALIRGGAVNQDGRSSGVTAPNGVAQRDVLRRAVQASGVRPDQVGFIEAHGTGTRLGDPIEVEALAEVYGREQGAPVYLGSSKTNIGHLEAAAGIAGLIKVVLSLHRGAIPPNVHFERLNPHVSFAGTTFAVPTELTGWPAPAGERFAGVSSFGFSGTNAHLILSEAPDRPAPVADDPRPLSVLALSAKSETALVALARRYADRLGTAGTAGPDSTAGTAGPDSTAGTAGGPGGAGAGTGDRVADLCFSANTGRSHFRHRLATTGRTAREIAGKLTDFVKGIPGDEPAFGQAGSADVVFLFTGQGPQRVGMAGELYRTQSTFRQVLDHCDEILRPLLETPLLSVLYPADPASELINQTTYSQPALFAVEYAIASLWRSWGVEPVAVLGHSFGEYVAACFAGAMSLEDGLKLVVERGRLMQALAKTGVMATVFAAQPQVAEAIAAHLADVSIAAVNGPANTAISGDRELVSAICAGFTGRGVRTKQLRISTASHSPLIEPILDDLRRALDQVEFAPPRIPLVANLTGELWPWDRTPDADYFCRHARQPVLFAKSMATLRDLGYRTFLEVGPAPTLLGLISDGLTADQQALLLPSLRPKQSDWQVMLSTAAQLYVHGADLDWAAFDRDHPRTRVPVPTYPFDPTPCWMQPTERAGDRPADWTEAADPDPAGQAGADQVDDDDLLYRLEWQPAGSTGTGPAGGSTGAAAVWLVLADPTGVGDELAALLAARGTRCVRVEPGAGYRYDPAGTATVRPDRADDLTRLLDELDLAEESAAAVVHLWSLTGTGEPSTVDELLRGQRDGCLSAVRAAQALARAATGRSMRLWLVTRGAVQPVEPAPVPLAIGGSTLWGLGRSLQQEQAASWGGLIDLDPAGEPAGLAAGLLAEIERGDGEDQVALRGADRYLARLVRKPAGQAPAGPLWRRDASYLITGGLGGLGLAVARDMARAGARRLILLGRTPLPPRREWSTLDADDPVGRRVAGVRELEELGATVVPACLDVSDEDAVRDFLRRYDEEGWPPIRGVVHAAGVGEVAPLLDLDAADLERHLRAKAVGGWILHRLLGDRPLDFFVLFSSTSSILSSPFVASYAAANAFLDALAQLRRDQGRPGLSIQWGIWQQTGLAARGAEATPGLSRGMGTLTPGQALRVFRRLLRHDEAQIAVVPVDWSEWGRRYRDVSGSSLLAGLVDGKGGTPGGRAKTRASLLPSRDELLAAAPQERLELLTGKLLSSVSATLGAQSPTVGLDQSLFDLGLDSLMAVELRNEIEGKLKVVLPISVFLEGASVRLLAGQILDRLAGSEQAAGNGGAGTAADTGIQRVDRYEDVALELLAQLDDLSEEQAGSVIGHEA